jgi:protein-S-isoprenylcysteine O-methyltransferase Ste14
MYQSKVTRSGATGRRPGIKHIITRLVGSGDRIVAFTLPFAIVGLALWAGDPSRFAFGGSSSVVSVVAAVALAVGIVTWAWSAALILAKVPNEELITGGPFAVVKHPLYTSVGLLVLPAAGILLGTWLGAVIGVALYAGSRLFAPDEERELQDAFEATWDAYRQRVLLPWV